MMKRRRLLVVLIASFSSLAWGPAEAVPGPPARQPVGPQAWIQHVGRYPGGLTASLRTVLAPVASRAHGPDAPESAARRPDAGGNEQINTDSAPPVRQLNPAVAVSLDDPLTAVAAANDEIGFAYQIMRTKDGGRTWRSTRQETQLPTGEQCPARTPSIAYSRRDHAFYLAAACAAASGASVVQVWRSVDNGATWTPPIFAAQAASNVDPATGRPDTSLFYDWQRMAVDNSPTSAYYGRVYVTWTVFHILASGESYYCPQQVAHTDHVSALPSNTAFTMTPIGPNGGTPHGVGIFTSAWSKVAVQPDGSVLAMYAQEGCNDTHDAHIRVARSVDGGRSFGAPKPADNPGELRDNPNPNDVLPNKTAPLGISPSLAVSPKTGTIAVAYQNDVQPRRSGADIWVSVSRDNGRSWTGAPLSTDRRGDAARHDQFFSSLTADMHGQFWALWLDNRRDPANHLVDAFEATSRDDGHSWRNWRISTRAYDPEHTGTNPTSILGVDTGIAASSAAVYPVWPDARHNAFHRTGVPDLDIFTDVEVR